MSRNVAAFLMTLSCITACGGDDATEAARTFDARWLDRRCAQFLSCEAGGDDPYQVGSRATLNRAECERRLGSFFDPETEFLLEEGRVRLDADAARSCLDSFDDLCAGGYVAACDDVIVGTVADGGACAYGEECVSGRCRTGGPGTCGTCLTVVPDGGACVPSTLCESDSFCYGGVCTPDSFGPITESALGEPCGDSGDVSRVCEAGTFCDASSRCAARLGVGLRCASNADACVVSAVCLPDDEGVERCAAVQTTATVGADCGPTSDGTRWVECDRDARLRCSDDGVCAQLFGDGRVGSDCDQDFDCRGGICDRGTTPGECVADDLPLGVVCRYDEQCRSMQCGGMNTCVAPACF